MALQLYLGNSGTGKSYSLYHRVIEEAMMHPERNYIVLVPEQFTMQTQKDLVMMHPKHGILNIDVLSFQRLAYRIFEETGGNQIPVIDEIGKTFIVQKVAMEKQEQFVLLGRGLHKIGCVNEMKSLICELLQYDIGSEQLEKMIGQNKDQPMFCQKLKDVKLLLEAFLEYKKEKYITSEEILDVLCRVIEQSQWIRGTTIVLDGFTGFTPIQKRLMAHLMKLSADMWITITFDSRRTIAANLPEYHLFHMSSVMLCDIEKMAQELQIERKENIILSAADNYRLHSGTALLSLEKNLFRSHKEVYEGEQEQVHLTICQNPLQEIVTAAQEICRLIQQQSWHYRDLAVVTADMETYGNYVKYIFEQYQIPCFVDQKRAVINHPAVEFLRSVMEVARLDFTYSAVVRFLRTGFVPFSKEQCDHLENYLLAAGIRGTKKWREMFAWRSKHQSAEELDEVNQMRQQMFGLLFPFCEVFRRARTTVREKSTALFELMRRFEIRQQLQKMQEEFEAESQLAMVREYAQIYPVILEVLDQLVQLLGEEAIPPEEYEKLLEAGFLERKVGIIPPGVDQVLFGDIERSRMKEIKGVFFLGVNDGTVPKKSQDAGVLSELERDRLEQQGIELAPGARRQYFNQKFYLYLNLTKPSERLYLSFSKNGVGGEALNASYLIDEIHQIFPDCPIVDAAIEQEKPEKLSSKKQARDYLMRHLSKVDQLSQEQQDRYFALGQWFASQEGTQEEFARIFRVRQMNQTQDCIDSAVALALYNHCLEGSVTRLEQYARCAYSHFLQYGLALQEREEAGFAGLDFGNILHAVLEQFSRRMQEEGFTWDQVQEERPQQILEECLNQAVTEYANPALYATARDSYQLKRMHRMARRTVWAVGKQLMSGRFQPEDFEVSFSHVEQIRDQLGHQIPMQLRGRIDRLDRCEQDDKVYLKVVDYKTGSQEFKLLNVYYGYSLQLILYMGEAIRLQAKKPKNRDRQMIPAAVLYYRIKDPVLDQADVKGADVKELLLKELCVDGLVSEDQAVLEAMDQKFTGKTGCSSYSSPVIPVSTKKDGALTKYSKTVTTKQMHILMDYVEEKMKNMGEAIIDGHVAAVPAPDELTHACTYCSYHGICHFDRRFEEFTEQQAPGEAEEIVLQKMEQFVQNQKEEAVNEQAMDNRAETGN